MHIARVPLNPELRPTPGHLGILMLLSQQAMKGSSLLSILITKGCFYTEGREDWSRSQGSFQGTS